MHGSIYLATILLAASFANGRLLLQSNKPLAAAQHNITEHSRAVAQHVNHTWDVAGNASQAHYTTNSFYFDYTLTILRKGDWRAFMHIPEDYINISEGCGDANERCYCKFVVDPSLGPDNLIQFKMYGEGTDNRWTGLDFQCNVPIYLLNVTNNSLLPTNYGGCLCTFHIFNPFTGENTWDINCPCLAGFSSNINFPKSGHAFVRSDVVMIRATYPIPS